MVIRYGRCSEIGPRLIDDLEGRRLTSRDICAVPAETQKSCFILCAGLQSRGRLVALNVILEADSVH